MPQGRKLTQNSVSWKSMNLLFFAFVTFSFLLDSIYLCINIQLCTTVYTIFFSSIFNFFYLIFSQFPSFVFHFIIFIKTLVIFITFELSFRQNDTGFSIYLKHILMKIFLNSRHILCLFFSHKNTKFSFLN